MDGTERISSAFRRLDVGRTGSESEEREPEFNQIGDTYLKSTTKSIEQNRKEKKSTSGIETACSLREIVEDGTDDESHYRVSKKLRECQGWISFQPPETSSQAQLDLSDV
jgi:hypothetical protein